MHPPPAPPTVNPTDPEPAALPWAPAADENRHAILAVLARYLRTPARVLEIGAGTGQHAVHFAAALPWLDWCATELPAMLPGLAARLALAGLANLPPPRPLDVATTAWPDADVDHAYTANTAHILPWPLVGTLFAGLARRLRPGGLFILYGPVLDGTASAESNLGFDAMLRARDPLQGVRELGALQQLAAAHGFEALAVEAMPRDNVTLVWRLVRCPAVEAPA